MSDLDQTESSGVESNATLRDMFSFLAIILMCLMFISKHWFYDYVPPWASISVFVIAGLTMLITLGWKMTAGIVAALALVFNLMPGGYDPVDTWLDRINEPVVGDHYIFNHYELDQVEEDSDTIYIFYKVAGFSDEKTHFVMSQNVYNLSAVESILEDKAFHNIEFSQQTDSFTKTQLSAYLTDFVIGGVFRPEKDE